MTNQERLDQYRQRIARQEKVIAESKARQVEIHESIARSKALVSQLAAEMQMKKDLVRARYEARI